jgi:hypothetical protein
MYEWQERNIGFPRTLNHWSLTTGMWSLLMYEKHVTYECVKCISCAWGYVWISGMRWNGGNEFHPIPSHATTYLQFCSSPICEVRDRINYVLFYFLIIKILYCPHRLLPFFHLSFVIFMHNRRKWTCTSLYFFSMLYS